MQIPLLHQQVIIKTEKIRDLHRSLMLHSATIPAHEMEHFLAEIRHLYEVSLQLQKANAVAALNEVEQAVRAVSDVREKIASVTVRETPSPVSVPVVETKTTPVIPVEAETKLVELTTENKTVAAPAAHPVTPEIRSEEQPKKKQVAELHDLYADIPTLADQFTDSERVVDKLTRQSSKRLSDQLKSPVKDLRTAIGLNEKFQFINQLFSGDAVKYNTAIDFLNNCSDPQCAHEYLDALSEENHWENHATAAGAFVELIDRRVTA